MSASPLSRRLPQKYERSAYIGGSAVGWMLFALLFLSYSGSSRAFAITLCGPCVLVLTYLAFGGDIPLSWRQRGYRRIMLVALVFWVSFLAALLLLIYCLPQANGRGQEALCFSPEDHWPGASESGGCATKVVAIAFGPR